MVKCESLERAKEVYGEENLVRIVNLRQIVTYVREVQPVWVDEGYNGKLTCWFEKSATKSVWEKWKNTTPDWRSND